MTPETRKKDYVHQFFPGTGSTYDHMVRLCTFGFDHRWKQKMLGMIPEGAQGILDQACGTGIFTFMIARRFPKARIIGVDVQDEYLQLAREKARDLECNHIEFIQGRAEVVHPDGGFDCITSCYLAKYAEIGKLTGNIKAMLRKGGMLMMQDFTYPESRPFARIWELYFKLLQTLGTWKYPQWQAIFDGLPGLLRESQWTAELIESLQKNGFSSITRQSFTLSTAAIITARKE